MMSVSEGVQAIAEGLVSIKAVRVTSRAGERVLMRRGSTWSLRKMPVRSTIEKPAIEGGGAGSPDPF